MDDCLFCKIIRGEIPSHKVYEDEEVLAFLDIEPINPGHTLVIPKEHCPTLLDVPEALACKLLTVTQKLTNRILKAVESDSFNLYLNNGEKSGRLVDHFHWHIIPRFEGDGYELWHGKKYGDGEAEEVLKKIKEKL